MKPVLITDEFAIDIFFAFQKCETQMQCYTAQERLRGQCCCCHRTQPLWVKGQVSSMVNAIKQKIQGYKLTDQSLCSKLTQIFLASVFPMTPFCVGPGISSPAALYDCSLQIVASVQEKKTHTHTHTKERNPIPSFLAVVTTCFELLRSK